MAIDPVSIAITAAMMAAQMGLQAMQKIEGPRLEDLKVTVADHGTPIAYFWGTRRLDVPIVYAEEINEVKRRRKTKGGKYNDYTYYGTWFCLIASHEIEAVKRIWFDKHLVYDATGSGPLTPFSTDETLDVAQHIRIMLGGSDQEPDSRMETTLDALHGAGSCPAFRGMSGVMFVDVPLEKVGNRVPQVSIEATRAAVPAYPYESFTPATERSHRLWGATFSPDGSRFVWGEDGVYEMWDVAARSLIASGSFPSSVRAVQDVYGISNDGALYAVRSGIADPGEIKIFTPDVGGFTGSVALVEDSEFCQVIGTSDGDQFCCVVPLVTATAIQVLPLQGVSGVSSFDAGFITTQYFRDPDDNIWAIGGEFTGSGGDGAAIHFRCIHGPRAGEAHEVTAPFGHSGLPELYAMHNGKGSFVVCSLGANYLYLIDDEAFTVTSSRSFSADEYNTPKQFIACPPGKDSIWLNVSNTPHEVSTEDLTSIRTIDPSDWKVEDVDGVIYTPLLHALICFPQFTDIMTIRYLDRTDSGTVTLRSIIEDVAQQCGLDSSDIDASDCTQTVLGYSITQGSGKAALDRLLEIYDVDARPHNFQIQFVRRGDSAIATIDSDEFVSGEQRFRIAIRQDTDLPVSATMTFADPEGDQQPNTVLVRRALGASDGIGELAVNLSSLVLDVDEARQLAERYFRRQWNGRETYEMGLFSRRLAVEPADVYGLTFDGIERTARNTKLTISGKGYGLKAEWERDAPLLASLVTTAGATFDGRREDVIMVPLLTKGFVLDIPLVRDSDNDTNPILYFGAGPFSEGFWPGAVFSRSADGVDYDEEVAAILAASALTWGTANGTFGDGPATVWDRGHTLSVTVKHGELVAATEAACDANPLLNLAMIGDEMVQFTTPTLVSADSNGRVYTLSGFKRGRRGTEWATGTHATGDRFVLLDRVSDAEMGASDLGDTIYFRAVTHGRDPSTALPVELEYAGISHQPYAPCHLNATKGGTNDWTITWRRRSRIGALWTGGLDVPLGESSEDYEVDILDGPGGAVLHTYAVTSALATYSSADQATYAGGDVPVGDLHFQVRQIGDLMDGRNAVGAF